MTSPASTPTTSANIGRAPASPLAEGLTWAGLILVLAPMLFRAMTQVSTLPYWDMDPLISWSPLVGIGPAGSLLVDALIIFGAGLLLIGTARHARSAWFLFAALLVSIGCVPIVYHGWSSTVFTLGQQRIGASWASAMIAGLALWHAGADRRIRIVAFAAIVAFIAVLAVRGFEQVVIEHPGIVENFKRNRDAILAAQGWTPDSSMARGYERRLMQAEATGWFGLSNVYASFAAASSVAFGALSWVTWTGRKANRDRTGRETIPTSPWPLVLSITGLALSLGALALAGSKGGFAAAAMGLALVAGAMWISRPKHSSTLTTRLTRFAPWLGPALVAAALLAVVARGLIGERIGELSVLFRWFYMQAATRIAMDQPLLGVGPDGFKDAYLIFKNPLSPEEVGSPHSILFDWWACLGICGFAWIGLWLWWVARAGTNLFVPLSAADSSPAPDLKARPLIRATSGIIILATLAAIWTETAALTPEAALIRIIGLGLWLVLAGGVVLVAIKRSRWLIALAAATIVFAVHGQIEVTGSMPQSAGLFVALTALAASRSRGVEIVSASERLWARGPAAIHAAVATVGVVFALNSGLLVFRGVIPTLDWEFKLHLAAEELRPLGEATQLLNAIPQTASPGQQQELMGDAAAILARASGRPVKADPEAILVALRELRTSRVIAATDQLADMCSTQLIDWRIAREGGRLFLIAAPNTLHLDRFPFRRGGVVIEQLTLTIDPRASANRDQAPFVHQAAARLSWLSTWSEQFAVQLKSAGHDGAAFLEEARRYGTDASKLDPFNLPLANRRLRLAQLAPKQVDLLPLARRVLELDDLQRLDRSVRGLTPAERREVEDLVKRLESAPKPTPTIP